ncbi:hypothetical protein ACLB2K_012996 [Fragaria x ananassa]
MRVMIMPVSSKSKVAEPPWPGSTSVKIVGKEQFRFTRVWDWAWVLGPVSSMKPNVARLKSSECNPISRFECNICSGLAQDPIVTLCGHLYCWPCIYKWLSKWNSNSNCWVCNAVIEENKLIPLYGKGIRSSSDDSDSGCRAVAPASIVGRVKRNQEIMNIAMY